MGEAGEGSRSSRTRLPPVNPGDCTRPAGGGRSGPETSDTSAGHLGVVAHLPHSTSRIPSLRHAYHGPSESRRLRGQSMTKDDIGHEIQAKTAELKSFFKDLRAVLEEWK